MKSKDNENSLLVFSKIGSRGFLTVGYNGKTILGLRQEDVGHPNLRHRSTKSAVLSLCIPLSYEGRLKSMWPIKT